MYNNDEAGPVSVTQMVTILAVSFGTGASEMAYARCMLGKHRAKGEQAQGREWPDLKWAVCRENCCTAT